MRYRIYRASVGNSHAVVTVEKILLAAIATTLVGLALGLDRPDWCRFVVVGTGNPRSWYRVSG